MSAEKQFYKQLQDVPELPDGLYQKIEKKIQKNAFTKRLIFSVAASLVLFAGALSIAIHHNIVNTLDKEVVAELDEMFNFINGEDLDNDVEMYAIIDEF